MCGCVSDSEYKKLEERVAYLESIHGISINVTEDKEKASAEDRYENDEVDNTEYMGAQAIVFAYGFDAQHESFAGDYYQLRLNEDDCTLTYYDVTVGSELRCDFSIDVYDELLRMICNQPLEKYKSPIDENGKILYETVPHILGLYLDGSKGTVYFSDPSNINEIIAKFEELKVAASE